MEGKQQEAYEGTMDIATKIEIGFYGRDDDFEDIYDNIQED